MQTRITPCTFAMSDKGGRVDAHDADVSVARAGHLTANQCHSLTVGTSRGARGMVKNCGDRSFRQSPTRDFWRYSNYRISSDT